MQQIDKLQAVLTSPVFALKAQQCPPDISSECLVIDVEPHADLKREAIGGAPLRVEGFH